MNIGIDIIQEKEKEDEDDDGKKIDPQQKERMIQEKLKQRLINMRKEKEKKENELETFNQTYNDLIKENLIYEIKNKMLEQMIRDKKLEYQSYVDKYYGKSL